MYNCKRIGEIRLEERDVRLLKEKDILKANKRRKILQAVFMYFLSGMDESK